MTKHTYYRATDGTVFLPEPTNVTVITYNDNAQTLLACLEHEKTIKQ